MLKKLCVNGFKSLHEISVDFPRFTVLFGPNAAGKSNMLDAVQLLSDIGTARTLSDAFRYSARGYPIEAFSFPSGGMPELLSEPKACLSLEATIEAEQQTYQYRVAVEIATSSGVLKVADEYLALLNSRGGTKGNPKIERVEQQLRIRRRGKPAHPREEPVGLGHSLLSDPRLSDLEYQDIERCRAELSNWKIYYLDPRMAMRRASPPADVRDVGSYGQTIAPFLYRLQNEEPKRFDAVLRTLKTLVPSVQDMAVDLDKKRGMLDITVRQGNVDFSSRVVSEGTLRVLALCAIAVNPWAGSLVAFEEPENGVHPRRLELIAQLLGGLAIEQGRQVVVTTHSALFCEEVLKLARRNPKEIGLFAASYSARGTDLRRFDPTGPLFQDKEIADALCAPEDGYFEGLVLRGLVDG